MAARVMHRRKMGMKGGGGGSKHEQTQGRQVPLRTPTPWGAAVVIDGPEDMSKSLQKKCVRGFCRIFIWGNPSRQSRKRCSCAVRCRPLVSSLFFLLLSPKFVPWELPFPPPVKFQLPEGEGGGAREGRVKRATIVSFTCPLSSMLVK